VLGAHQQIHPRVLPLLVEQLKEIRFAVAHIDHVRGICGSRARDLRRHGDRVPKQLLLGSSPGGDHPRV